MTVVSTGSMVGSIQQIREPGTMTGFVLALQRMYGSGSRGSPTNPGSLMLLDKMDGAAITVSGQLVTDAGVTGISFFGSGRMIGSTIFGFQTESTLIIIDPLNGQVVETLGTVSFGSEILSIHAMSCNPLTDVLYVSAFTATVTNTIMTVDLETRVATSLVEISNTGGLAFSPSGDLFIVVFGVPVTLAQIDPNTGATIGIPVDLNLFFDGLGFDRDNVLYGTEGGSDAVYVIDVVTGTETLIGNTGAGRISSIAFSKLGFDSGSFAGAVSNVAVKSFDGDALQVINDPTLVEVSSTNVSGATLYGYRVVLDGVDVSASVVEEITILNDLDRLSSAEISLHGKAFSFVVTESTWTRKRLDVYFRQGPAGSVTETLEFSGFVNRGVAQGELVFRITALDLGLPHSRNTACLELDPGSGLTRDVIINDLLLTAGFVGTDFPGMKEYGKPYNFTGPVWGEVVDFIEPEGLHMRVNSTGAVEGYEIRLKDMPDHRWDVSEMLEMPTITPPEDVESLWIFRGDVTVSATDSQGVTIEIRSTPIFGIFNNQTTHIHQSDGQIVERSFGGGKTHDDFTKFQLIKVIESEIHTVGNVTVLKIEREIGFKNPRSAQFVTVAGQSGPGPQGTDFVQCFFVDNQFVVWSAAKFVKTLERIEVFAYDEDGTDIGSTVESFEYFQKTHGVETTGGNHIVNVYVGSDHLSYARHGGALFQIEEYGLRSRFDVERVYDDETGAQSDTIQRTFSWYSVRTTTDNNFLLFDGSAQEDLVAVFQLVELETNPLIVDTSLRKVGEINVVSEYDVTQSSVGAFDWGQFSAEAEREVFRTTSIEATSFDALNASVFTRTTYTGDGRRVSETFPGRPPIPRFLASPFTTYLSEPAEVISEDPLVETWFGRKSRVVQVKHAITIQELEDLLTRRRSRELSWQIEVIRLQTLGEIGDTVLITDFNQGLFHLGVIISVSKKRGFATGVAEYHIEVPLYETGLAI